jgi:hypothetical protein
VLAPMLGVEIPNHAALPPLEAAQSQASTPPEPANYTFNQVPAALPEPEEEISDPFQRRVRNALKFSSNNGHDHRGLQPAI